MYIRTYDTPDFPALGTWGKHLKALPIPFAPLIVTFTVSYKISGYQNGNLAGISLNPYHGCQWIAKSQGSQIVNRNTNHPSFPPS